MELLGVGLTVALAGALAMLADYLVESIFFRGCKTIARTIAQGVALGGLLLLGCGAFWVLLCWVFN